MLYSSQTVDVCWREGEGGGGGKNKKVEVTALKGVLPSKVSKE